MDFAATAVNDSNINNLKDILSTYNKVTEACFIRCVSSLNERSLTAKESSCVTACAGKFINGSQRMMTTFMEVQGRRQDKLVEEAMAAMEKQKDVNTTVVTGSDTTDTTAAAEDFQHPLFSVNQQQSDTEPLTNDHESTSST